MPTETPAYYDNTRPVWRTMLNELPAVLVINTVIGVLYTAQFLSWNRFGETMVFSHCIGFGITFSILALRVLCTRLQVSWSFTALVLPVIGIPVGFLLGQTLARLLVTDYPILNLANLSAPSLLKDISFTLIGGVLGIVYFSSKVQLAEARQREEEAKRAVLEAELRSLQAQIEPHFLFNTLANLDALIGLDPKQARVLLGHINHYLRSSLTHARSAQCTLGDECEQLRAYLSIMEIRLPDRLCTTIACPPECAELLFAPMLLQPLVENAVKHGIEPSADGGSITVTVRIDGDLLKIEVSDTGTGLNKAPCSKTRNSTGLANVRERLNALYGSSACLQLFAQEPTGTRALVCIPLAMLEGKP